MAQFPTTSILDQFPGALSSNWTTPVFGDATGITTSGGQALASALGYNSAVWTAASFGQDMEAYFDVVTPDAELFVCARVTDTSASPTMYNVDWSTTSFIIQATVAGTNTTIGSGSQNLHAGDSIGISVIGNKITAWFKLAAGGWQALAAATDTTVTGVGQIGMVLHDTTARVDNFGGGVVVESPLCVKPNLVYLRRNI